MADILDAFLEEEKRYFPPEVMEKARIMQEKTTFVLDTFQIPKNETVIQDYRCSIRGNEVVSGRLFITQNYLIFASKDNSVNEAIAFVRITAITREKSLLLIPSIGIEVEASKILLSGFVHRDETYNLLRHLWTFQPTYVSLTTDDMLNNIKQTFGSELPAAPQRAPVNTASSNGSGLGRWDELLNGRDDQYEHFDTDKSTKAVALAEDVRKIQSETLEKLEQHAEGIDRVERNIKHFGDVIDYGQKNVNGMNSVVSQAINFITPEFNSSLPKYDRTIKVRDQEEFTDVPILMKHPNDFLEPGLLRFAEKTFYCLNSDRNPVKKYTFPYKKVKTLVLRARHQHLDIKFENDAIERFRLCSSFIQALVNELFLRTDKDQLTLIYEPGVRQFQYGSHSIRSITLCKSRDDDDTPKDKFYVPNSNFGRLLQNAPEEVVSEAISFDNDVDDLAKAMKDIHAISDAMGTEVNRQADQVTVINKKANTQIKKSHKLQYNTAQLT